MGTPTIGGTTTGSVTENSGVIITGQLEDVGFATGTADDTFTITSSASYGMASVNPATGLWSYDLNDADPTIQALDPGDTLSDIFTVRMLDADGRSDTQVITITISGAVCFAAGTLITTPAGPRAVETLCAGMEVQTMDAGAQPLLWVGKQRIAPKEIAENIRLRPVVIKAGALGQDLPTRELRVSRQHRMLISGPIVQDIFGAPDILVPAIRLVGTPGITLGEAPQGIDYFHVLLADHHILFADGAPSESFLTGPQAMATLSDTDRAEITALMPQIALPHHLAKPARPVPISGRDVRHYRKTLTRANGCLLEDMPVLLPACLKE
ncbi:Hint domain-containing protein [Rhodobacteraceae bacterium KMM 6894]|nr:Hint domain-containing protein [Rhodobacteraceae bacterium KMM 6894]